ncbi:hypothetical protein B1R32_1161 [Abditibacterium utsteinense]|uniref:Uncharacterized protein n=1 Tax=Abditibacterium utsteinense TaxID=1960156 RepID=A0A2S8SQG1_9BACT|nr:hypothetical protein B1R32_1161 [Abditibacterium utsteinense]
MLKITTRIFAAAVLSATLASVSWSASACENCMKGAKMSTSKSAAFKSKSQSAKAKAKTSANAKTASVRPSVKKIADMPMCPKCQKDGVKDKI